ncbi:CDP-alcohol phosphatidyltransferase family protein [Shouchella lonarensis]|uniref:Phosphatidylglycerophosphate synthase n=1 Tax=Shouchella lonarensis TaxID=1464122 RepID=A0A1G6H072_9BACI|nr:CDP-alcohol phosphatidyltransferase family protein [Shouchella lonarensis]SDB87710.1 Phosphatidylglycerophosphate synthase [Shouchella lonarensis]
MTTEQKLATTWFDTAKVRTLRAQSQAYSTKEDLWSWYVLRRLSIFVTIVFLKCRLTPNAVSWLSAFFVVASGVWVMQATPLSFVIAFFCYNIGYLFDCVDGEMARLTGKTSRKGYFIDLLIQGATLPVYLSILLAILTMADRLQLSSSESVIVYGVVTCIIMALFIPISYQLTHATHADQRDPVNQIRTKALLWQFVGVLLGLPGFFVTSALLSVSVGMLLTGWYLVGFLLLMVCKVGARFVVTLRTFQ